MTPSDLSGIPFFEGLSDQLQWHLSRAAERKEYAANEHLFRAGQARQAFWVIIEGALAVETPHGEVPTRLATLGAGEVVGEGLLLPEPAHATDGRVLQPIVALRFGRELLEPLLKDQPVLYAGLVARAARATRPA